MRIILIKVLKSDFQQLVCKRLYKQLRSEYFAWALGTQSEQNIYQTKISIFALITDNPVIHFAIQFYSNVLFHLECCKNVRGLKHKIQTILYPTMLIGFDPDHVPECWIKNIKP